MRHARSGHERVTVPADILGRAAANLLRPTGSNAGNRSELCCSAGAGGSGGLFGRSRMIVTRIGGIPGRALIADRCCHGRDSNLPVTLAEIDPAIRAALVTSCKNLEFFHFSLHGRDVPLSRYFSHQRGGNAREKARLRGISADGGTPNTLHRKIVKAFLKASVSHRVATYRGPTSTRVPSC